MTHDIAHCNNALCPRRDNCLRFIAHKDIEKRSRRNRAQFTYIKTINPDECTMFWDYIKYNEEKKRIFVSP